MSGNQKYSESLIYFSVILTIFRKIPTNLNLFGIGITLYLPHQATHLNLFLLDRRPPPTTTPPTPTSTSTTTSSAAALGTKSWLGPPKPIDVPAPSPPNFTPDSLL